MRALQPLPIRIPAAAGVLLVGAVACSDAPPAGQSDIAPDAGPPADAEPPQALPAAIETVAPASVRAGDTLTATCRVRDEHGEELAVSEADVRVRYSPAAATERRDDGKYVAIRAGSLEAVCSYPEHGLLDEAPPTIDVQPGPIAAVETFVDRDHVQAGGEIAAHCEAYDAWGNAVDDAGAELRVVPDRGDNTVDGMVATLTIAGAYEFVCDVPGATSEGAEVEVSPGPPVSLAISRVPSRPIYGIGEIITIEGLAVDAYDNAVPEAEISLLSQPEADVTSGARLRYLRDGVYEVTASVLHPGIASEPPSAQTTITVDGSGPAIACNFPGDGAILERTPGEPITFEGAAADLSGVSEVRVDGELVAVDGSGAFSATVPTRFGINFVRLSAADDQEKESTRTCSFLVAEAFSEEDRDFSDAVAMALNAAAVDDGSRSGPIGSLADVLHAVLNSAGLHDSIHELMLEANPIKPSSCDLDSWFGCLVRSEINYRDSDFPGPNNAAIELLDGGFLVDLDIHNASLDLDVSGTFNTSGTVTVDTVAIDVPFDAYFAEGRPRVAVRHGDVVVSIDGVDTDFSGVSGWFLDNIIIPLARGRITDMLEEQVSDLIVGSLGEILDDLLAHLDIGALARTLEVPRLDGGEPIPLKFDPGLSSLDASSSRLLFGLSTRFDAPVHKGRASPGAPIELPAGPRDPGAGTAMGVTLHAGILNQVMHALWRAAFFDAAIQLGEGGGASVEIETGLPPVVVADGTDDVELSLGDVVARLHDPDIFPEPIELGLGLRARIRVSATAEEVQFFDFSLEEVHVTSFVVSLDADTREIIEGVLGDILAGMIERALDEALPALPVPSFELPESVSEYGLPVGAVLGLEQAALAMERPFVVLRGALGLR